MLLWLLSYAFNSINGRYDQSRSFERILKQMEEANEYVTPRTRNYKFFFLFFSFFFFVFVFFFFPTFIFHLSFELECLEGTDQGPVQVPRALFLICYSWQAESIIKHKSFCQSHSHLLSICVTPRDTEILADQTCYKSSSLLDTGKIDRKVQLPLKIGYAQ